MPLALLANLPWKWIGLGLALLAAVVAIDRHATWRERDKWEHAVAEQKTAAAEKLAASEAKNRAQEKSWADSQRIANDRRQDDESAIAAAADKYRGIVAQLMRERAGCRARGGDEVPGNSAAVEVGDGSRSGESDVLPGPASSRLEARYREADVILARLRECRAERLALSP